MRRGLRGWLWVGVFGVSLGLAGCGDDDDVGTECGNGVAEPGEDCDGQDLGQLTCNDLGNYVGGVLGCQTNCTFDTSMCTVSVNCGNGTLDTGEDCDGANLDGNDCADVGAYTGGTLSCANDCSFNTALCTGGTDCGNGTLDTGEDCDGVNLDGKDCEDVGAFSGGTLSCANDCSFNTTLCTADTACPRETLSSSTSFTYHGDTTGLPNLVTSSRLEWTDAPDDSLSFTAPEAGEYEIVVTAEPSTNGGCGTSVWDYGTDSYYDASWCPGTGATTELDGFYSSAGYPYTFAQGETVLIWFSCTYWADAQYGPYTFTVTKQ